MNKTIILNKKQYNADGEQLSVHAFNLVLSDSSSIVDLPTQVRDTLISNNKIRFKAVSWCMFPVIWAGDTLKIEPIKPENTSIGDIVLYKFAGRAYSHRLVKTYKEKDRLYIVTSGEKEYRNNQLSNYGGIPADNILGKVIEIKRGRLCFRPDEINLNLGSLILGKLKLSLWTLAHKIKQYITKFFIKLQGYKIYRTFFRNLITNKLLFFIGTSLIKNKKEINNFCFYRGFEDFSKDFTGTDGLYNLSVRINNRPVGNISLFLDEMKNCKVCTLSNLIVRIPYRGGGIGSQLVKKAVYLCSKIKVDEVKIALSREDAIAINFLRKLGFVILQ